MGTDNSLPRRIWFRSPATASGGNSPTPSIASQPTNQSVPMGLSGSFAVKATSPNLQYQWSRNDSPISGATASIYTTAATAFSDSGSVFTVVVSNSFGSVTSNPASLTVTARAPKPGDLRFRQVDAASTVNGYTTEAARGTTVACPPQAEHTLCRLALRQEQASSWTTISVSGSSLHSPYPPG